MSYWEWPYPKDEHDIWLMCAHPFAVAYEELKAELLAQNFKYPIDPENAVDCLYSHVFYADDDRRYHIMRNDKYFPDYLDNETFNRINKGLFGKE